MCEDILVFPDIINLMIQFAILKVTAFWKFRSKISIIQVIKLPIVVCTLKVDFISWCLEVTYAPITLHILCVIVVRMLFHVESIP